MNLEHDKALIAAHGGPRKLAEKLGYDLNGGGVQRVTNWISRGIPSAVKLERPDLFLSGMPPVAATATTEGQGA